MSTRLRRTLARVAVALLLAAPTLHAQFNLFFISQPVLQCSGAGSITTQLRPSNPVFFTTVGTYSCTTTGTAHVSFTGIGPGGAGGTVSGAGNQDGGGGGGSGAYTTGTTVTLFPGKTYSIVITAGSSVSAVTISDGTTTFAILNGGANGGDTVAGAGGAAGTTGSNLHAGQTGGVGGVEAGMPPICASGGSDASGAGAGGGGRPGDAGCSAQFGGNGRDQSGQAPTTDESFNGSARGGDGGAYIVNGVSCGLGGGGGSGAAFGTGNGHSGARGCARFDFVSAP